MPPKLLVEWCRLMEIRYWDEADTNNHDEWSARKEGEMKSSNNIETSKDIKKSEERIRLAEERNDSDQVIINISPDIFEQLQKEYFDMKETGYGGSYADFLRSKIRV